LKKKKKKKSDTKEIRCSVGKWNFSQNACPRSIREKKRMNNSDFRYTQTKTQGGEKNSDSIRAE
jgi:hypothetical protein